ncbi:Hypothetical protein R9X50_00499200 [Acrodontium crateriforme]|uniref:CBM1 domain-containing protein n=1 Tax=Acrodontium crateriforme TaxID=150365 RepID=A0AAQ3M735_9PEZI|nr:Hypothetical protein R9X50_00499200 [Acrodontium crateriforme]
MSTISILNQIIDDQEGTYRIRFGEKVGYLTISTNVFDEDTMCRPYLLIPKLPKFPQDGWTRIKIARPSLSAPLEITATNNPLPEIETVWHQQQIDVLSLKQTKRHRSNVHEVFYSGIPAISKIAAFDWEIPRLERETWAYSILDQHQRPELGEPQISPRVLGHLTECGRVIGILLERLDGQFASADDLPDCANTLRRLHEIGLIHGDVNRYNFIVDKQRKQVSMVDFEHAAALDEFTAKMELQSLASSPITGSGTAATYGQCGGIGWTGPTKCPSDWTCKAANAYYSQCLQ